MLFETFCSFFQKYKKPLSLFGIFLTIFFIFGETTFANNDEIIDKDTAEKITKVLNFILSGAAIILGLISSLISMFLYPGWVNGTLFGLQDYFREIWILISNVVYFIFAAILIVIAFMNIIGKGEGTWELKQALPKFIVGVLIVPFSWFFVQFILSLTSILTVGVLTLPYDTFKDKPQLTEALDPSIASQQICTDFIIDLEGQQGRALSSIVGGSDSQSEIPGVAQGAGGLKLPESLRCDTSGPTGGVATIKEILEGERGGEGLKSSVFGVINIYTYGILRIQNLDTIGKGDIGGGIKEIADLLFKIVFDLLFVVVYLLLMVALFLALFVRVIRLWIYMMLSPAFGLLYFFGKSSEGVGSDNAKFSIKEFIALALVPVYVSAALAFGLVFILVAGSGIENDGGGDGKLDAGGFSLTIVGALGDGDSEKSIIAKLIVQIFGIVILWIAVMAALRSSETTRTVVEPIAAFGKSVGELAAKAPTYAPIIPTGSGGVSAEGLKTIGGTATNYVSAASRKTGSDFVDRNRLFGSTGTNQLPQKAGNALEAIKSNTLGLPTQFTQLKDALREAKSTNDLASSSDFVSAISTLAARPRDKNGLAIDIEKFGDLSNRNNLGKLIAEIEDRIDRNPGDYPELKGGFFAGVDMNKMDKTELNANKIDKILKDGTSGSNSLTNGNKTPESSTVRNIDTTIRVNVTGEEKYYKNYVENNDDIPERILTSIANKISTGEDLNSFEIDIRQGDKNKEKIEEILQAIKDQAES